MGEDYFENLEVDKTEIGCIMEPNQEDVMLSYNSSPVYNILPGISKLQTVASYLPLTIGTKGCNLG